MAAEVAGSADRSDAVLVCSVGSLTVFDAALFGRNLPDRRVVVYARLDLWG